MTFPSRVDVADEAAGNPELRVVLKGGDECLDGTRKGIGVVVEHEQQLAPSVLSSQVASRGAEVVARLD